jgi:ABC-type branched-subunit amino acid transport system substrate-binding protein
VRKGLFTVASVAFTLTLATSSLVMAQAAYGSTRSVKAVLASSGSVNILAIVDTSGPNKAPGSQELLGVQAAAAYYNSKGGILGKKVKVTALNDNGDPATATSLAVKALGDNPGKYSMVYPGEEGTVTAALIPIMARYKAYAVAIDDGNFKCASASACPTEFSLFGAASPSIISGANWLHGKGYKNVGILEEQISFTQSETPVMTSSLKKDGVKTEIVGFPETALSLTAEVSQLKADGAQAIYAEALGPAAGYALNARTALSWNVPVLFDPAASAADISTLAPVSEIKNAYETVDSCADPSDNFPAFKYLFKYAPSAPVGGIPCFIIGSGWTSVVTFATAAQKAKSVATPALVKATEHFTTAEQDNPLALQSEKLGFTTSNHEDVLVNPSFTPVLPVGTIVATRLHPVG